MEKGEILTVAGGLFIVLIIALIANPQHLSGLQAALPGGTPVPTQMPLQPPPVTTPVFSTPATPTPVATPSLLLTPVPPYRIYYTDKPFTYPVVRLPDRLDMFGESDIKRSNQDIVTFAYVADSRGGLTRVFTVPYPVWTMDVRVFDNATPNTGSFRMALCYAANGTVLDGVELIHPGTAFKRVQTSNVPLYLIVSTTGIDGYRIDMQTSREYYETIRVQPADNPGS